MALKTKKKTVKSKTKKRKKPKTRLVAVIQRKDEGGWVDKSQYERDEYRYLVSDLNEYRLSDHNSTYRTINRRVPND